MEISGARVLVAGASGGLGGAIARELAARGARLAVSGRDPERLAGIASATGGVALVRDLTEPTGPEQLVGESAHLLGGLDAVVCAAGVVAFGPVAELDDRVLTQLFTVNALAPIRLSRAALGALGGGGAIVNVSAIVAEMPTAGMAAYSASKAALTAFDAALRREARRAGVRVLDVRPPHTETGLAQRPLAREGPRLAAGRDPGDVARRIVDALAADAAEADLG
ncbi:MAG: SDR family oxidoreductase [Thermoleophilia bacterium]